MDRKLLELLVCPVTQGPLEYDSERGVFISNAARLVYPVRDGIPILLESEAMPLSQWESTDRPNGDAFSAHTAAAQEPPEPSGAQAPQAETGESGGSAS